MSHKGAGEKDDWINGQTPDVYFTQGYYTASALLELDSSNVQLVEWADKTGSIHLPLILRKIQGTDYFDATSAYGYGGPWAEGNPDVAAFLEYFEQWASDNSVVCTFLRFHPIIGNAEEFRDLIPLRKIGPTAGWDLSGDKDLVAGMSKGHRKTWRRAVNAGVEARVTVNPSDVDSFVNLYKKTMDRLSAGDYYRFSDEYWAALQRLLSKSTLLVEAVHEGKVVAAAWCLFSKDFLHFHLSGTSDEGRKLGGAVICRVAAAQWGQEHGIQVAHHGGGVGGEDSTLLDWKRKFDVASPLHEFHVAQIIHNEKIFADLSKEYPIDGFFPPWRAPKRDA